jgi:ATP-binding cassette subfamily B protein
MAAVLARGFADEGGGALLLAYWALNMPIIGQRIAQIAWQYPTQRNLTLRLIEPLGALEDSDADTAGAAPDPATARAAVSACNSIEVTVAPAARRFSKRPRWRSRPAPTSRSSARRERESLRSSGLLLGWHRPASGQVMVDGERLEGARLDDLRRETAWIDPAVQLWNRFPGRQPRLRADRNVRPACRRARRRTPISGR